MSASIKTASSSGLAGVGLLTIGSGLGNASTALGSPPTKLLPLLGTTTICISLGNAFLCLCTAFAALTTPFGALAMGSLSGNAHTTLQGASTPEMTVLGRFAVC